MPSITITLTDTPAGGVAIHTDFKPAIGSPCSPAQSAVLDIMARTKRDWGMIHTGGKAELDDEDHHASNPEGDLEQLQKRAAVETNKAVHKALFSAAVHAVRATDAKRIAALLCSGDLIRAALLTKLGDFVDAEDMALALGYTFQDGEDETDGDE